MRCAIYARVSTRDNDLDTSNRAQEPENQARILREFCQQQGWDIIHEYVDRETGSVGSSKRPEFRRMFEDASRRKFDVVLFWSLDRFSREGVYETLQHLRRLEDWHVGFRSYTEQYLDSCGIFKDAVLSILATMARQERLRMSERIKAGMARTKAQGKPIGPPRKIIMPAALDKATKAGMSLAQMAQMFGVSRTTMHRRVKEQSA